MNKKGTFKLNGAAVTLLSLLFCGTMTTVSCSGPRIVNLGTAGDFAILAKVGVTATSETKVTGDVGASPAASGAIAGFGLVLDPDTNTFSTSSLVTGRVYAADYTSPTPAMMANAIGDMDSAFSDAEGRSEPDDIALNGGVLAGLEFQSGLYKWATAAALTGVVKFNGNSTDIIILQIGGALTVGAGASVILEGGVLPENIFWQVSGATTVAAGATLQGIFLCKTSITFGAGTSLTGRAFAQTSIIMAKTTILAPITTLAIGTPTIAPTPFTSSSTVSTSDWEISFSNVTSDVSSGNNTVPTFNVLFHVSDNKMEDVDTHFLDSTCNQEAKVTNGAVYEIGRRYNNSTNNEVLVQIGVNTTAMIDSDIFNNDILSFCVRADLIGRSINYNKSIAFTETIITMNFNMAGNFGINIKDAEIVSIDPSTFISNKSFSFSVDACICEVDGNNATCIAQKLKQNQEVEICFFSLSDSMMIESIQTMEMVQDNEVRFSPVKDSQCNALTQYIPNQRYVKTTDNSECNGARVSTRIVSAFFRNTPNSQVIIKGQLKVAFTNASQQIGRTLIQQDRLSVTQASGRGSESGGSEKAELFALRVLLDDGGVQSGAKRDVFPDPTTKTFILTAIISGIALAIAIIVTIYIKEK